MLQVVEQCAALEYAIFFSHNTRITRTFSTSCFRATLSRADVVMLVSKGPGSTFADIPCRPHSNPVLETQPAHHLTDAGGWCILCADLSQGSPTGYVVFVTEGEAAGRIMKLGVSEAHRRRCPQMSVHVRLWFERVLSSEASPESCSVARWRSSLFICTRQHPSRLLALWESCRDG